MPYDASAKIPFIAKYPMNYQKGIDSRFVDLNDLDKELLEKQLIKQGFTFKNNFHSKDTILETLSLFFLYKKAHKDNVLMSFNLIILIKEICDM